MQVCQFARWPVLAVLLVAAALQPIADLDAQERVYKYRRRNGTWAFTDNLDEVPKSQRPKTSPSPRVRPKKAVVDLATALEEKRKPKNAIERAGLAVVVVKSPIGTGSGFFISERGHLLTNRHVLEPSRRDRARQEAKLKQVRRRFAAVSLQLQAEQQRLNARREELASYRDRLRDIDYQRRHRSLNKWQRGLDQRRDKLRRKQASFRQVEYQLGHRTRVSGMTLNFELTLVDGRKLQARKLATDERWDLALLQVEGYKTPYLLAATRKSTAVGDRVLAIGNPASLRHSTAQGIFSGRERGHIKTDAKIYPGNSGGPLINAEGEVLGINTFKKLTHKFEGLGFAVPIERAMSIFADWLRP